MKFSIPSVSPHIKHIAGGALVGLGVGWLLWGRKSASNAQPTTVQIFAPPAGQVSEIQTPQRILLPAQGSEAIPISTEGEVLVQRPLQVRSHVQRELNAAPRSLPKVRWG